MNRPRLVAGARLQYDDVREEHMLLVPEGAVRLNETAVAVLELCDGKRTVGDVTAELGAKYEGVNESDVRALLDGLGQRGLVVDVDA